MDEIKLEDNQKIFPAIALRGMTVLPQMVVHFDVSREKSIRAIEQAMMKEQKIVLITQKNPNVAEPEEQDLYRIGILAVIKQVMKLPKNLVRILVEGIQPIELEDLTMTDPYLEVSVELCDYQAGAGFLPLETREAMSRQLLSYVEEYGRENPRIGKEFLKQINLSSGLEQMMAELCNNLPIEFEERQRLLETLDLVDRFELLCVILNNEIGIYRVRREIQEKVKERVDKNQREYILREQIKVIQEELGDRDIKGEAEHFEEAANQLDAPIEVKEKLKKEINRMKMLSGNLAENGMITSYIETILEMPWNKKSQDTMDIKRAREILEAEHYGLEKVKERVLEFLAVRAMTKKGDSPIICLVGPPGTGKTSIARSIAHALDKKYVRICLGGVRDEAEIRGHRRTYIGSMPGRIANGLRMAGVSNPLMLLDEIDKVSSDYKGDTSSALLEVLDSEQNMKFRDHYIELPIDLSEVLFLATANDVQGIPKPLLDRMEIIEVTSYTQNEKLHIAMEHLFAKQMERNGLKEGQFSLSSNAMESIIQGYTREAGVRELERKIGQLCRKAARELLEEKKKSVKITESNLEKYLGKARFSYLKANMEDGVGLVRGLAWTSVGGDTLQIEVNIMPGKGELQLTGQLGDVMKESAKAGISYIRSVSKGYKISEDFFKKHDMHIHIPEGAVPKDGPSAGITMATAMLSAITEKKVKADVAMTGEITLRGRVLAIGGLKEKLLAAKNAGIKTVIVPKENERDVEEISTEIKKGLKIVYAETMKQVIATAFVKELKGTEK